MRYRHVALSLSTALLLAPALAAADDPKFDYGKPEDVKEVKWKASAQVGAYGSTGNAQTLTVSGAINVSRDDGANRVTLDVVGAYSQAWTRGDTFADSNGNGVIDQDERNAINNRSQALAAANWLTKLRYDRFFTPKNTLYILGFAGQDFVVKKDIIAGGQAGYSRLIVKNDMNELSAEIGYDFSHTSYQVVDTPPTNIHSLRLFVGYLLTIRKETAINASVEAIINGTDVEVGPLLDPDGNVDPNRHKTFGQASRLIAKLGLTTVIYKKVSFKFGATAKYDAAPSPIPIKLPMGVTPPSGPVLRYDNVDLIGEAALVVTFL